MALRSIVSKTLSAGGKPTKRIITEFADETGLVYFGYVSQRDDEHHIVRGLTVSTKHRDDHYCIGTYENYDVIFVERTDTLHTGKKHVWHILEIDLKTAADIPHAFIGSGTHGYGFHELLATKYPTMLLHTPGSLYPYPADFNAHFTLYTTPAHAVTLERLITPSNAELIAKHFKGLVVELTEDSLYVYSERPSLSHSLLMTMLTNGIWLARQLDQNSRQL